MKNKNVNQQKEHLLENQLENLLEAEFDTEALNILELYKNDGKWTSKKRLTNKLLYLRELTDTIAYRLDPKWNWSVARLDAFTNNLVAGKPRPEPVKQDRVNTDRDGSLCGISKEEAVKVRISIRLQKLVHTELQGKARTAYTEAIQAAAAAVQAALDKR